MRVLQLSVHEQLEVRAQGKHLVTHLDVLRFTFLDDLSSIDRLDDSIDLIHHVLNEDWLSRLDSELNSLDHLGICQPSDLQLVTIGLLDPNNTLELRINHEGVSLRVGQDSTILSGYSIWRKTVVVPSCFDSIINQNIQRIRVCRFGDVVLLEEWYEVFKHNSITELLVERTNIGNEG